MKMKVVVFAIVVVLFSVWYMILSEYLDRPTVEISVETNACVRAYGPDGEMSCADALKVRHEAIYVDSEKHSD